MVPEPRNEYDKNAVAVMVKGKKVGYIKAEECLEAKDILKKSIQYITVFISGGKYKIVSESKNVFESDNLFSVRVNIKYLA